MTPFLILNAAPNPDLIYPVSSLAGKTVIITGGTSGVGRETALELSMRGARLVLVCRY